MHKQQHKMCLLQTANVHKRRENLQSSNQYATKRGGGGDAAVDVAVRRPPMSPQPVFNQNNMATSETIVL